MNKLSLNISTGEVMGSDLTAEEVAALESIQQVQQASAIDLSNIDMLEDVLKALLACTAEVGGLSQAQAKALFKQKYDIISGN